MLGIEADGNERPALHYPPVSNSLVHHSLYGVSVVSIEYSLTDYMMFHTHTLKTLSSDDSAKLKDSS